VILEKRKEKKKDTTKHTPNPTQLLLVLWAERCSREPGRILQRQLDRSSREELLVLTKQEARGPCRRAITSNSRSSIRHVSYLL